MTENKSNQTSNFHLILFLILAIILVGVSTIILRKFKSTKKTVIPPITEEQNLKKSEKANLEIVLDKGQTIKLNQDLKAQIVFDTVGGIINGADVILKFDPKLVAITEISGNSEVFKQVIVNQQKKEEGKIKITAYLPKADIQGKYTLAFLNLRLLENKPANLEIEFLGPNQLQDSNLISKTDPQKDILESTYPLRLEQ